VQNCAEEHVAPAKTVPTSNDEASVALSTSSKASKKSMKAGEKLMKNRSTSSAHSKSVGSVKSFESSLAVKESVHEEEVFGGLLSVASEASNAASVNETFLEELRDSVEEHVAPSEGVPTQNDETSVASFASSKASKKSLKAGKKLLKIKNKVRDASMRYIGLTKSVKKQGESVRSQPEVSEPTENEIEDESLKEKNEIVDEKNLAPEEKAKEIEKEQTEKKQSTSFIELLASWAGLGEDEQKDTSSAEDRKKEEDVNTTAECVASDDLENNTSEAALVSEVKDKADDYSFIGDLCYFPECDMNESKDKTKQDGNALEFFSTFPSLVASSITETYAGAKNWVTNTLSSSKVPQDVPAQDETEQEILSVYDKKQEEVESHDGESSKLKTLEEQCMATTDEFCGL
jgi:hypothetical protein